MTTPQERRSPHEAGNGVCLGGQPESITDTSATGQPQRLLSHLRHAAISTFDARRDLNVMASAVRVMELREQGHNIVTIRVDRHDDQGGLHRNVALYVLQGGES